MSNYNYQQMLDEQREERENELQFAIDFETECLEPVKLIDKIRTALKEHAGMKVEPHVINNFLDTVEAEISIADFCDSIIRDLATYKCENDIDRNAA